MTSAVPILTELIITDRYYLKIFSAKFDPYRSRNVQFAGKNPLMLLITVAGQLFIRTSYIEVQKNQTKTV